MAFEKVDTKALKDFQEEGAQYVKDFADIKRDFEEYNKAFLAEYEGRGAEKYETVSGLITEKVSDFEGVFKTICENLINPTLENFKDLDKYLDDQNESMKPKEDLPNGADKH